MGFSRGLLLFCLLVVAAAVWGERRFNLLMVLDDSMIDRVGVQFGDSAQRRLSDWRKLLQDLSGVDTYLIAQRVNDFFNRIPATSDVEVWGVEDYWATPVEMLSVDGGDEEDFAIAKYFSVVSLGLDSRRLKMTYVTSKTKNQAHMVLAYYPEDGSEPLILDNIEGSVLLASQRRDLIPVYHFDGAELWMAKMRREEHQGAAQAIQNSGFWMEMSRRFEQILKI